MFLFFSWFTPTDFCDTIRENGLFQTMTVDAAQKFNGNLTTPIYTVAGAWTTWVPIAMPTMSASE